MDYVIDLVKDNNESKYNFIKKFKNGKVEKLILNENQIQEVLDLLNKKKFLV
jgi:hypothetical protein